MLEPTRRRSTLRIVPPYTGYGAIEQSSRWGEQMIIRDLFRAVGDAG
jgi:hypothetical protein